jgi:hypothetical protein
MPGVAVGVSEFTLKMPAVVICYYVELTFCVQKGKARHTRISAKWFIAATKGCYGYKWIAAAL